MQNLIVRLQNAHICQQDQVVLRGVSMTVSRGEFVYLIGKTGSGKSSLLKVLYGALPLKEGKGEVAGFDLLHLTQRQTPYLRRKIGVVFQDFNLLTDRNVESNLRFVLSATGWKNENAIRQRIAEVLSMVGLSNKLYAMPHALSGGEQQRVVIARALLNNPELLIADEPTGNLDPDTSDEILQLMRQLALRQNTAVLLATHDYRIIENFPARIIRCIDGRIVDEQALA